VLQVAVKPYPACHFVHACVDAALALRATHGIEPRAIERIEALVPAEGVKIVCEPVANKKHPKNSYDAQFSIPYIVAAAFHRGRFTLAELTEEAIADPEILALAERVDYAVDPNSGFPRYYSGELIVILRDGQRLSHREHMNRGCGDRPLSEDEIVAKFEANAGRAVAPQRARAIRDAVLGIEEAPDMMALARALGGR
jgi:2-methylcitrate dehydratase PrpD